MTRAECAVHYVRGSSLSTDGMSRQSSVDVDVEEAVARLGEDADSGAVRRHAPMCRGTEW